MDRTGHSPNNPPRSPSGQEEVLVNRSASDIVRIADNLDIEYGKDRQVMRVVDTADGNESRFIVLHDSSTSSRTTAQAWLGWARFNFETDTLTYYDIVVDEGSQIYCYSVEIPQDEIVSENEPEVEISDIILNISICTSVINNTRAAIIDYTSLAVKLDEATLERFMTDLYGVDTDLIHGYLAESSVAQAVTEAYEMVSIIDGIDAISDKILRNKRCADSFHSLTHTPICDTRYLRVNHTPSDLHAWVEQLEHIEGGDGVVYHCFILGSNGRLKHCSYNIPKNTMEQAIESTSSVEEAFELLRLDSELIKDELPGHARDEWFEDITQPVASHLLNDLMLLNAQINNKRVR